MKERTWLGEDLPASDSVSSRTFKSQGLRSGALQPASTSQIPPEGGDCRQDACEETSSPLDPVPSYIGILRDPRWMEARTEVISVHM